jgi:hypothetical protein
VLPRSAAVRRVYRRVDPTRPWLPLASEAMAHEHYWFQIVSSLGWVRESCSKDGCETLRVRQVGSNEWRLQCFTCEQPLPAELDAGPCEACFGAEAPAPTVAAECAEDRSRKRYLWPSVVLGTAPKPSH